MHIHIVVTIVAPICFAVKLALNELPIRNHSVAHYNLAIEAITRRQWYTRNHTVRPKLNVQYGVNVGYHQRVRAQCRRRSHQCIAINLTLNGLPTMPRQSHCDTERVREAIPVLLNCPTYRGAADVAIAAVQLEADRVPHWNVLTLEGIAKKKVWWVRYWMSEMGLPFLICIIYYIVKWQPFDFNVGSPILWLLWHCLYMQCSWKLSSLSQASTTSMSRSNASSLSQYHVNWHVPHDQINDDHGKWPDCHYTATFVCHFCYGSISHQVHNVIAKDTRVMAICCDKRTRCIAVVFSDDLTSRNGTVTSDNVNEPLHLDYVLQCINGSGGWTKGYRGDLWRNTPPGFTIPQWTIKSILMHTAQCSSLRPTDRCAMSS